MNTKWFDLSGNMDALFIKSTYLVFFGMQFLGPLSKGSLVVVLNSSVQTMCESFTRQ